MGNFFKDSWEDEGFIRGLIYYYPTGSDDYMGSCGFEIYPDGSMELGPASPGILSVNKELRRQGIGNKLLKETLEYAIECAKEYGIKELNIWASTSTENIASKKILGKLGLELSHRIESEKKDIFSLNQKIRL